MQATIAELWVYPIKSCKGQRLNTAKALPTGIQNDRSMMVVDANDGTMVTQRHFPLMARITPSIDGNTLTLTEPESHPIQGDITAHSGNKTVTVWNDTLTAIDMGDAFAHWFSHILKAPVRLVRFDPEQQRLIKKPLAPLPISHHHFADAYPYLLLSLASLRDLNDRLLVHGSGSVDADRFRPNIVIDGVPAHTEDYAESLTHASGARLILHSACTRCSVPTIDQVTGLVAHDQQPTVALSAYRFNEKQGGITFGMNALISQTGELHVGDTLDVALSF